MFDIGFSELILIFIIGLVVLGPKRLPIAIRTVMGWVRTVRGLAANVQNELAQELKLQELQESIKKAEELNLSRLSPELEKTVADLKQSAEKMKGELASAKGQIQALTDEQVADIQDRIEQEDKQLADNADVQHVDENAPLAEPEHAELSPAEIAELAEADEEKLMAYYPPDDDLASPEGQDKKNVS
ncbi:Sec-independent protein translocase protein TatB [Frederiksenia canicola]|uniref:Sec-independent protein translocase protein TatB n=1 Tax=Frederiksenia canicola TaxID=123824 RepID=A0AAE6X577_9PAST|nr:Sec-independent protein translocase protein TatB [Frederiksenia canicola]QIM64558.1 twin arginine-targeting protein translocase TatB [Frederiksenia canicola]RPE90976.1 sec-independent protein translocase protein TatB [Frederiksenia canicola]